MMDEETEYCLLCKKKLDDDEDVLVYNHGLAYVCLGCALSCMMAEDEDNERFTHDLGRA